MPIRIHCPNPQCRTAHDCPDEHAGKVVKCSKCGTQIQVTAAKAEEPSSQILGGYRLVRKIGQGGMGAVYEAVQVNLDRQVALKVISRKASQNSAFLERFYREAKSAAALNHPNIVQVYDIGEEGGHHFFSMEFIDGENVMERLRREGHIPLDQALGIVSTIATALKSSLQRNIIHRDIKPDNIMIARDGLVKLADLGLAKEVADDSSVTQTGAGMGTPYYMAPEQAKDARSVDHRADIYALGITLLHIATGKRPYDGETAYSIILAHASDPLPTGKDLGRELPPEVEKLIQKMAGKKPEDRYQDYDKLLEDLERVRKGRAPAILLSQSPTVQALDGSRMPSVKPSRKGKALAAAACVAVTLGGIGIFILTRKPNLPNTTTIAPVNKTPGATRKVKPDRPKRAARENRVAEMFAYAEKYAKEAPNDFQEIINKFDEVGRQARGTVMDMKTVDRIKEWKGKWEVAALAEFEKRKAGSDQHAAAGQFDQANQTWKGFPRNLLTERIELKIEQARGEVLSALKGVSDQISKEAIPLLVREPAELTEQAVAALINLKVKAENPPAGSSPDTVLQLGVIAARITESLAAHERAKIEARRKDFVGFWKRFSILVKRQSFDLAENLLEQEKGALEEETRAMLQADNRSLKSLTKRAKSNLGRLKGTTIRVAGIGMTVDHINGDKLYVKQGAKEIPVSFEKLESETILGLGVQQNGNPLNELRVKGLYTFFYGNPGDASAALKAAADAGADVAFYLAQLVPEIAVTSEPAGAEILLERKSEGGEWEVVEGNAGHTPARLDVKAKMTYRVTLKKSGFRSAEKEIEVADVGQYRVKLTLKKGTLPEGLSQDFDIPSRRKDKYSNPIRLGFDRSGLPKEIQHKKSGMCFVLVPPGEFMMGGVSGYREERPIHKVRITRPFYIGKYEINQEDCKFVFGEVKNQEEENDRLAMHRVSWVRARQFISDLKAKMKNPEGVLLTLPTEAQWEYACRAGTDTSHFFGDKPSRGKAAEYAWFNAKGTQINPVGKKKPNPWGIYDTSGNVNEWCHDYFADYSDREQSDPTGPASGKLRVIRGGSSNSRIVNISSTFRMRSFEGAAWAYAGFRLALAVPGDAEKVTKEKPEALRKIEGTRTILDRDNTLGWIHIGKGSFNVDRGVATTVGGMGLYFYRNLEFRDFVLKLDFNPETADSNSGVYVRFPEPLGNVKAPISQGYEIQIYGGRKEGFKTGSIFSFAKPFCPVPLKKSGTWNQMEINCIGHDYFVRVNRKLVTQFRGDRNLSGFIGLQNYARGVVRFTDIKVKELTGEDSRQLLKKLQREAEIIKDFEKGRTRKF